MLGSTPYSLPVHRGRNSPRSRRGNAAGRRGRCRRRATPPPHAGRRTARRRLGLRHAGRTVADHRRRDLPRHPGHHDRRTRRPVPRVGDRARRQAPHASRPRPGAPVWLDGSRRVHRWRSASNGFVHEGWRASFDSSPTYTWGAADGTEPGWSFVNGRRPMAAHPDQVWIGGVAQRQVSSLSKLERGTFFVDDRANRLYLGSDPRGRKVRASTLAKALAIRAAGTTVRGIGVRRYAPVGPAHGCRDRGGQERHALAGLGPQERHHRHARHGRGRRAAPGEAHGQRHARPQRDLRRRVAAPARAEPGQQHRGLQPLPRRGRDQDRPDPRRPRGRRDTSPGTTAPACGSTSPCARSGSSTARSGTTATTASRWRSRPTRASPTP